MRVEKLFNVLVMAGVSAAAGFGTTGCGDDSSTGGGGGGAPAAGGGQGTGGASSGGQGGGGGGGGANSCDTKCAPSPDLASWTDCGGCCCWLPIGTTAPVGSPTCGDEPCCVGRGR
ncbi:MAG TPA: hypothetical protein VHE30_18130 [Polyangiaceae bacterium]|nr:hypothetical protein [Polyangiaceae bacterium]